MARIDPDDNDICVWKLDESAAPFVNSSTSPDSVGATANLNTLQQFSISGELSPKLRQAGPFPGSFCVETLGTQNGGRAYLGGANSFRPQPPITISGWIYLQRYDAGFTQHFIQKQHTIGVWSGVTFQTITFQNRTYTGQVDQFDVAVSTAPPGGESTSMYIDYTRPIPLGQWCHFGHTFDGNQSYAYINGDIWSSSLLTGSPRTIVYDTSVNSGPWYIGAIPSGSGAPEETYCKMADWRIANVVRPISYFRDIYFSAALNRTGRATGAGSSFIQRTTYYKLRASCTAAPSGYVTWVNTSGDDTGKPSCSGILGPTVIVDTWVA